MPEICLGILSFVGDWKGSHIDVRVLGQGPVGDRPTCGTVRMNLAEWTSVQTTHDTLAAAERDLERLRKIEEVAKLIGEHWRAQSGVNASLLDMLAEVVRHG